MRSFVSLDLDAENCKRLAQWLRQAQQEEQAVRWVPAEQLHLTLQFLGEVMPEQLNRLTAILREQLAGQRGFTLQPTRLQTMKRPPRVLYLAFREQPELVRLAETLRRCTAACGIAADDKPFLAHLTLGRVRQGEHLAPQSLEKLAATLPELLPWQIDELYLKESILSRTGAQHRILTGIQLYE